MRIWMTMLGGLLVWAAHFFALYGIGEFAGVGADSRASVIGLTLLALGVLTFAARRGLRHAAADDLAIWSLRLGQGALLLGALAVLWQAFPAVLT